MPEPPVHLRSIPHPKPPKPGSLTPHQPIRLQSGKYVTQVEVTGAGLIQVTFGNEVNSKILNAVLTFTPTDYLGSVSWSCIGDATLVDKWLPPACH